MATDKRDKFHGRSERTSSRKTKKTSDKLKLPPTRCLSFKFPAFISKLSPIPWLFAPQCSKSLGVVRALFGLLMVMDVPEERGLSHIDTKYGNPMQCHFPLFDWLSPLRLEYMAIVYLLMWIGALGVCLGSKFKSSCLLFCSTYWYLMLLDKTSWNNHSYLFGLLSILFMFSSAHHSYSIDSLLEPAIRHAPVPRWNYAIFRFQLVLMYFYAGLKKLDHDWIGGHSMTKLSSHWVFDPLKMVLSEEFIDLWVVHAFGLLLDLSVGFLLLLDRTRPLAILVSSAFHIINSRIFHIGQFPYVCLAMTPIFCSYNWPEHCTSWLWRSAKQTSDTKTKQTGKETTKESHRRACKQRLVTFLLSCYAVTQLVLPYSHSITKGYNNWTNGLYGYSWDMMVHSWDTVLVVVKVVDRDTGEELFFDPEAWVANNRYTKHGDMLIQYSKCVERNLKKPPPMRNVRPGVEPPRKFSNLSVYVDVWCSLNGRFQQRMFDPRQDLLKVEWSPFTEVSWLLPLLSDLTPWRAKISELEAEVHSWSNYSDALFVADFPGLYLENYIGPDLKNVSLSVLQGSVVLEQITNLKTRATENVTLSPGESSPVLGERFHKVHTFSPRPSCYVYTYVNRTLELLEQSEPPASDTPKTMEAEGTLKARESLLDSLQHRWDNFIDSLYILQTCFFHIFQNTRIPPLHNRA